MEPQIETVDVVLPLEKSGDPGARREAAALKLGIPVGRIGGITLRKDARSTRIEAGEVVPLARLRNGPSGPVDVATPARLAPSVTSSDQAGSPADASVPSLAADATRFETAFENALGNRDADGAVAAILDLDSAIVSWSRDTLQGDDLDRARAALRSMIVRLGAAATGGVRNARDVLGPIVEAALAARVTARTEKAYAVSDAIRDNLAAAGIEVRDTETGADWLIVG